MSRVQAAVTPKAFSDLQQLIYSMRLQIMRNNKQVCAVEAGAKLRDAGRKPRMPIEFRSQFGEDAHIWTILGGQLDGFFIEVGAFDGYNYAVTYAFEAIGWNGLLIEGIPERAALCKARRPNSRVVHSALSHPAAKGTVKFTVSDDIFGGMLSYNKTNAQHLKELESARIPRREVEVPVTQMDELLKDHKGKIDVAVIDVEGGELDVLAGFDLLKHRPRVLMLEDNSKGADIALTNYMSRQPYEMTGWVDVNRVYVHRDEAEIFERMKWM